MNTRPTPETDAFWEEGHLQRPTLTEAKEFARKLELERDEAREELQQWKMLYAWGGTPEHIDQFIKGQQSRIHEAQEVELVCEQLERERDEARDELEAMREAIKDTYYLTEGCADGAPDATAHDKLCNEIAAKLQPFIKP
ncbi:hypothetical protein UFOVP817_22 [uncultured Caudovirales phage]|uniref:Ead/Ea22-like family protein n=1 Tax=uncultured Caudovirales phage TaxID=2100421 RepID=A0A6J5P7F2_9CAUD|nr:hypothetical protein UFOVP817_22 [uncultured Caudovirales phage]